MCYFGGSEDGGPTLGSILPVNGHHDENHSFVQFLLQVSLARNKVIMLAIATSILIITINRVHSPLYWNFIWSMVYIIPSSA